MLVETVSANPREPHRSEAIDQNRLVASSLESRCHYSSFMLHRLLSVLSPTKLRELAPEVPESPMSRKPDAK